MPNPNLMSHAESKLIVRWLRREKGVPDELFPLDYFYQMSVDDVVTEVKRKTGKEIMKLSILEATRRVISIA